MIKFVIVGTQRTGTTLIRTSLGSHPNILCVGESFKISGNPYPGEFGYPKFLEDSVWRKLGNILCRERLVRSYLNWLYSIPGYEANGFKFMYSHTRRFPMVVPYVKENEIRVIHIYRKNVLKTLVSRLTATTRGIFHSREQLETIRIRVPTQDLRSKLEQIQQESEVWGRIFQEHVPYLKVGYESFIKDGEGETGRMLSFLEVDHVPLKSSLVKLNPDSLSDVVENYEEVKSYLAQTSFAWCISQ